MSRSQLRILAWIAGALALVAGPVLTAVPTNGAAHASPERPDGEQEARIISPPPIQFDLPTAGPLGSVSIIGDSVLHGSGRYTPTLAARLAERGWGPIRFRAGAGYSTGYFGRSFELTATYWLNRWRDEGWVAANVIVNIGANDTEFCATDVGCSYRAIMHVVDEIGPGPRIWWPQVTKFFTNSAQAVAWNTALDRVAAERPDFYTWDWPTELATGGYESNDNTHLLPSSYPKRSARMAEEFTLRLARARPTSHRADLGVPLSTPSTYVSVTAQRIVDTRESPELRQTASTTLRLDLTDRVPEGTTAAVIYVAAARQSGAGYVTARPCGASGVSAVLTFAGTPTGAPAIVAVDEATTLCVGIGGTAGTSADLIVDLQGAFVEGTDGLRLFPLDTPSRVADTRNASFGGEMPDRLVIDAPDGARALALNVAVANAREPGFLTAHPCGVSTDTATLNFSPGAPVSASTTVEVAADGTVCISSSTPTDVIVDMTAVLAPAPTSGAGAPGLAFVPIDPLRLLDTRYGTGGWAPVHGTAQTLDLEGGPPWAEAVTGTLTMVRPARPAFLQATSCVGEPVVASVNGRPGISVSNALTTGLGTSGRLCIRSSAMTQTVFDATGWWADASEVE